jgi:hypothetical protein
MICKDCRIIRYHSSNQDDVVELCPRHAEMEEQASTLSAMLSNVDEEARERRRYALLQAASLIYTAGYHIEIAEPPAVVHRTSQWTNHHSAFTAVSVAHALLAEIENWEQREAREGEG